MKKFIYRFENNYYHITGRFKGNRLEHLPFKEVWQQFLSTISQIQDSYFVKTISLVLMSHHFHMICESRLSEKKLKALLEFQFSLFFLKKDHLKLTFYNISFFKIENIKQYHEVYKYIYLNPVQAQLSTQVEVYPYSSLNYILYHQNKNAIFFDNMNLLHNSKYLLDWLNQS